jgi:hypothetical protein
LPHTVSIVPRKKMSSPSVIIRIITMGRPASGRSATRSMPMPTKNMVAAAAGMASHNGRPS